MARARPRRKTKIVLASASPRRRELLKPFYALEILPAHCNESRKPGENPSVYANRMARLKWLTIARKMKRPKLIVAADTIVALGNTLFGKPKGKNGARRTIQKLAGKTHDVLTSVAVGWSSKSQPTGFCLTHTRVAFRKIGNHELEEYLKTRQWEGKSGAYSIQLKAFQFTTRIVGSLTGVVGLPLDETIKLIEKSLSQAPQKSEQFGYHRRSA